MQILDDLTLTIGDFLWDITIFLAIILGIYYGFRTKFIQIRMFPETVRLVKLQLSSKRKATGVSSFQAFCVTLGGSIGTGNVAGVAMAIMIGGPGVVPWMWAAALLCAGVSFVENTLAQVYKSREGEIFRGGPTYYIEKALGRRWISVIYAFGFFISCGVAMAGLQTNTIALSIGAAFHIPNIVTAIIIAILIGFVIFGGIKRIAEVAEIGVPIMTIVYFLMLVIILVLRADVIPSAFALMFREAFSARSLTGATFGTVFFQGFKRGIFSGGAGTGDAPMTNASAAVSHPVKQGLFATLSIYIDTLVVCTITALTIIVSGVYQGVDLVGIELSQYAFSSVLGNWASYVFALCILMFCFTTLMSYYYCSETCLTYLSKTTRGRTIFRIVFIISLLIGGITEVNLMWDIADAILAFEVVLNMLCLLFTEKIFIKVTRDYIQQKKEGKDPVFHAKALGIENTEVWD